MFNACLRNFKVNRLRAMIFAVSASAMLSCGIEEPGVGGSSSSSADSSSSTADQSSSAQSSSTAQTLPLVIDVSTYIDFAELTEEQLGNCADAQGPVDLSETTDGSTCLISSTQTGEWLEYQIDMPQAGTFAMHFQAAAASMAAGFDVLVDGAVVGGFDVSESDYLQTLGIPEVAFNSGQTSVRIEFRGDLKFGDFSIGPVAGDNTDGFELALRVGDESYNDGEFLYQVDTNYVTAGTVISTADMISGTDHPSLYQWERYGDFSYEIPVANGTYDITLKMVEMYWHSTGRRIFNVLVEGQPLVSELDLFYLVGHDAAFDLTATNISVDDGGLTLDFNSIVNNATVSALVVRQVSQDSQDSSSSVSSSSAESSSSESSTSSSEESSTSSSESSTSSSSESSSSSSEESSSSSSESSTSSSEESSTSSSSEPSSSSSEESSSSSSEESSSSSSSSESSSSAPPDADGDGVTDDDDAFPDDPTETVDSDGDGVGDNADAFPSDANETTDSDGDGVGDNADLFPNDGNESQDSDGDGVGDNADQCAATGAGEAVNQDGCSENDLFVDTDGDGVADENDWAPNDPTESADSDADGVGDNADAFPNDPSESADGDGDGVGDNADVFPQDPGESADTDGDGVGDNSDAFPTDGTETTDADGDGVGDNSDVFPEDATEWLDSDADGVGDNADQCADTDSAQTVNADGCSAQQLFVDSDGDGVDEANGADLCLDSAAGALVNADGCSADQLIGDESAGATIWADNCASCHGDYVNDGIAASFNIDPDNLQKTSDATLASYIESEMPAGNAESCVEQCAADVAAYTRSLEPAPDADGDGVLDGSDQCDATPSGEAVGSDGCSVSQIDAQSLYASSCASCHGDQGQGGALPYEVWGKDADDLRAAIANSATMASAADGLSDIELEALGELMQSFPEPQLGDPVAGAQLYSDSGCAGCHGADRAGVASFPSLTTEGIESRGTYANFDDLVIKVMSMADTYGSGLSEAEAQDIAAFLLND